MILNINTERGDVLLHYGTATLRLTATQAQQLVDLLPAAITVAAEFGQGDAAKLRRREQLRAELERLEMELERNRRK